MALVALPSPTLVAVSEAVADDDVSVDTANIELLMFVEAVADAEVEVEAEVDVSVETLVFPVTLAVEVLDAVWEAAAEVEVEVSDVCVASAAEELLSLAVVLGLAEVLAVVAASV